MDKKYTGWIIAGCLLVIFIICGGLVYHFWLAPRIFLKQVDSAHDIIEDTYDAKNAIYNYEWFKSMYENIQATGKKADRAVMAVDDYKELNGDVKEWGWEVQQEYSRLNTIKLGLQNQCDDLVAQYNARSKMANREIFKDKLPFNVDKKIW